MLIFALSCAQPPDPFDGDLAGWLLSRECERPASVDCTDHDCQSSEPDCSPIRVSTDCSEPEGVEADVFVTSDVLDSAIGVCEDGDWSFHETPWSQYCADEVLDEDDPTPTQMIACEPHGLPR